MNSSADNLLPLARIGALLAVLCGVALGLPSTGRAQVVQIVDNRFQLNEDQIYSWVFQNQSTRSAGFKQSERELQQKIERLARTCELSDEQESRLRLAGSGDITRFFTRLDETKRSLSFGMVTQEEWQAVWTKVQPLRTEYTAGLHGDESLFRKSMGSILSADQRTTYEQLEQEIRERRYRAMVRGVIAMIEREIPLTQEKHDQLLELIIAEGVPRAIADQPYYNAYLVFYQLAHIPDAELTPLFAKNEWDLVQKIRRQGEQMRATLRQQGLIE
jgi:hypothetical protein